MLDPDITAADLLAVPARGTKTGRQRSLDKGYLYITNFRTTQKKPRYHIAAIYSEIPEHSRGSRHPEKRGHKTVNGETLHVMCDMRLANAAHSNTATHAISMGYSLCTICKSRRRRWWAHVASTAAI